MSLKKFQTQALVAVTMNFCSAYSSSNLIESNELLATKIVDGRVAYNLSFNNPSNHDAVVSELSQNFNDLYTKRFIAEQFSGDVINAMAEYASHPLLCCIMANDKVLIIDILTGEKVEIRVGKHPNFATLVGSTLYVLNNSKNTSDSVGVYLPGNVSVIDIITKTKVCDDIVVGTNPEYAILVGKDLYVLNLDTVSIIDTVTNKKIGAEFPHLAFDDLFRDKNLSVPMLREKSKICRLRSFNSLPIGNNWYNLNLSADTIAITPQGADVLTKLCDDIKVGNGARFTMPNGKYMCVISQGTDTISIIDISNNSKIGKDIKVGRYPMSVTWIGGNLVTFCDDGAYLVKFSG